MEQAKWKNDIKCKLLYLKFDLSKEQWRTTYKDYIDIETLNFIFTLETYIT